MSPDEPLTLDEVGALFGASTSARPDHDGLTLDEVGAIFRHEPPPPFEIDPENGDITPTYRRPVVWSRCDACGERVQGLISTLHPTTNKFGHWCANCYFSETETRPDETGRLDLGV